MVARTTSSGILNRLVVGESEPWSPKLAQEILRWDFAEGDHARVQELSEKAQSGTLTPQERLDLDEYLRVADLLAILQARARAVVNHGNSTEA